MRRLLLSLALATTLTAPAWAAPINYDEAVSGDLSDPGPGPLTTFTFDVGTNTVKGSIVGEEFSDDSDAFAFVVPIGTQLVSGSVTLADGTGDFLVASWNLRRGSANGSGGSIVEGLSVNSPGSDSLTSVPLGPDTYNISDNFFGVGRFGNATYTFSFELRSTAAVPEPASALLIGAGLAALGLARRRRAA